MEIISSSQPKANKNHECMWCKGIIKKGEIYDKHVCKHDYIYTWKNHLKCSAVYNQLNMVNGDWEDGIDSDSFMKYVYEFLYDNLSEEENDGLFGECAVDKVIKILKLDI